MTKRFPLTRPVLPEDYLPIFRGFVQEGGPIFRVKLGPDVRSVAWLVRT